MKTIDFAIDLGTTNSLIAMAQQGQVKVFKNPMGFKETLPSIIAFRASRTVIGDKAIDFLEKDPANVCMLFKRKMGSGETYHIPILEKDITPIELSELILRELIHFTGDGYSPGSIVITIPASFDTIQSNATKKAGYLAGFKEVVLLQEPIAACLAYANSSSIEIKSSQKWIVYDLGGGTFDVALVEVDHRELRVLDNLGHNFLGGADFDNLIVEKLIVPYLEDKLGVNDLWKNLKSRSSKFKGLYFELIQKAEEAKKELSRFDETEVELEISVEGLELDETLQITKQQFEGIITPKVNATLEFTSELIKENDLAFSEISQIILIGGSTYIPFIREQIASRFGIAIESNIDPTSAVVEGAAYYAGSKPSSIVTEVKQEEISNTEVRSPIDDVKVFYEKTTKDLEELISGRIESDTVKHYRIIRKDGGFDSGIKKMEGNAFSDFVPLLESRSNFFKINLLDKDLSILSVYDNIAITHGSYNVQGQPLPNDINLEVDDIDSSTTRLEQVFAKGSILPLRKKIYKTASKTILKDSNSKLILNIIEGKSNGLPSSGLSIGFIEVSGDMLEEDLIKGTDIEIELEVTESRDIKINCYLHACDQEINDVFSQSERHISIDKIILEINTILAEVESYIKQRVSREDYESSQQLEDIRVGLIELQIESTLVNDDDLSDQKYQIDDKKRKLIQKFDTLTRNEIIAAEIEELKETKLAIEFLINQEGNERFREKYERILKTEREVVNSLNKYLIRSKIKELDELYNGIVQSSDENFISYFLHLKFAQDYSNTKKAEKFMKQGDKAIEKGDYKSLRHIVYALSALLPNYERERQNKFKDDSKTGLG